MKRLAVSVIAAGVIVACWGACGACAAAPPKPVTGQVVDSHGKAVAGAQVYVLRHSWDWLDTHAEAIGKTDAGGGFTYCPKTEEEAGLSRSFGAWAPGFACGGAWVEKDKPIRIVLRPDHGLKGKVVDEKGRPVAGAKVTALGCGGSTIEGESSGYLGGQIPNTMEAQTRNDGSFVMTGIPDPVGFRWFSADLRVSRKGRATSTKTVQGKDIAQGLTLLSPAACTLEGRLRFPKEAEPATEVATVVVAVENKDGFYRKYVQVDAAGRFKLSDLPPGTAFIALAPALMKTSAGGTPVSSTPLRWVLTKLEKVDLKPSQPAKLDLVLCNGAIVSGIVTDKTTGKPISGAQVQIDRNGRPDKIPAETAVTDDQGRFEWRVSPGPVKVTLMWIGEQYVWPSPPSAELALAEGEQKTDVALQYDAEEVGHISMTGRTIPSDFELKPGTYDLTWDPSLDCTYTVRSKHLKQGKEFDALVKRAPALRSKNALRAACAFDGPPDGGLLAVIVDESKGTGKGYDIAYIDANRNRDLTDDKPIKLTRAKDSDGVGSEPIAVKARQGRGDSATANPIKVRLSVWTDSYNKTSFGLYRTGTWKGKIASNKGDVECAAVDSNANGIYGELSGWSNFDDGPRPADELYLDAGGVGRVTVNPFYGYQVTLDQVSQVGSKFYLIAVNETGNRITVAPYIGPTGRLLVRGTDMQGAGGEARGVSVAGKQGSYNLGGLDGRPALLPVGSYQITGCRLAVISKNGEKVPIDCEIRHAPVEIRPDEQAAFDISGKLSTAVKKDSGSYLWQPGSTEYVGWVIRIGNNTTVDSIGAPRPDYAPTVTFLDSAGKVAASSKAEFMSDRIWYSFGVPSIYDGNYTFQISLDTKTELGTITSQMPVRISRVSYAQARERFLKTAGKSDKARADFLQLACRNTIQPGEEKLINAAFGADREYYPGSDKIAAAVKWFPESGGLRVTADVTDAYFSTKTPSSWEWDASCVEVFLCPDGIDSDITQLFIVPEGPENAPRMRMIRVAKYPIGASGITASWKRTDKGYTIDALIPWGKLKGYKSGWASIPVELAIDTKTPDGPIQCRMNASPDCPRSVRGYALLKMK